MALFKILKGPENNLNNVEKHEGYAYITEDEGNFYIDVSTTKRLLINADKANRLKVARTISLSDGVTGAATAFNGSSNISIPVTNVKGSYVTRDVHNTVNSINDYNLPLIDIASAPRTAYLPLSLITTEVSTNSGSSWSTVTSQEALFNLQDNATVSIGSGTPSTNLQTRITIKPWSKESPVIQERYCTVNLAYINFYCYDHDCTVEILASTIGAKTTFKTIVPPVEIKGWPGPNLISFDKIFFGGYAGQNIQEYAIRFIFRITKISGNSTLPRIAGIRLYGPECWINSNEMMKSGRLYLISTSSKGAIFPSYVQGTEFKGNATSASVWKTARNITIGNVSKSVNGSANVSYTLNEIGALPKGNYAIGDSTGKALNAVTAETCTGNAATATKADKDSLGNVINTTYATKVELENAGLVWNIV